MDENAQKVLETRYFMDGESNWYDCAERVSRFIAGNDGDNFINYLDIISNMKFIPGGRILRNAGRPKGSLLNCFHIPIGDSAHSIGECFKSSFILWCDGGGVGVTFSTLRPVGANIQGRGGNSSGLVSFMTALDAIANTVESGGQRRAAALGACHIWHPEVEAFMDAKLKDKVLSCFNISVIVTKDFLEAVIADKDWEFKFNQQTYGKTKARKLWDKIIKNMHQTAEPGIIIWDNLIKNNSYYFQQIQGVNPCGEAVLPFWGCCDLGSIVLPTHQTQSGRTNWAELRRTIHIAVRFLDDVLDRNKFSINKIAETAYDSRRIGLGVTGLADYLIAKKLRYGSPESIEAIETLFKFIRNEAYLASVQLAKERGSFPRYDTSMYHKASFIRKLPAKIRKQIREFGIRNVTLLTAQPTGTTSLIANVSSGIEPIPAKAYIRRDKVSERIYIHPKYAESLEKTGEKVEHIVDAFDIKPEEHLEVQATIQRYLDGSISKTINIANKTTQTKLSDLLLEYAFDLKGVTVYRDGCREGQVITKLLEGDVKKILKEQKKIQKSLEEKDVQCSTGSCDV